MTADADYKKALVKGQSLQIGGTYNPFFGFFETPRVYWARRPDGSRIPVKPVKLFRGVHTGEINLDNLPQVAAEIVDHYVKLANEMIMEEVRLAIAPDAPSRQRCLWLCDTIEEARYWQRGLNGTVCSLKATGTTYRVDGNFLPNDGEPISVARNLARRYWLGEVSDTPQMERLFKGEAVVTEIDL